jgi:flagellar biosynthesis chaperone FliJ
MSRYRFRLETVLRVRRAQEEAARQNVMRANHAMHAASARRREEAARYAALPVSSGTTSIAAYSQERSRADLAAASLEARTGDEVAARVEVASRLAEWTEAAKPVAALERLDARLREEHEADEMRSLTATVDDVVSARWMAQRFAEGWRS